MTEFEELRDTLEAEDHSAWLAQLKDGSVAYDMDDACYAVILALNKEIARVVLFLPKDTDQVYLDWFVNRSPVSKYVLTSMEEGLLRGFEFDCTVLCNKLRAALLSFRVAEEFKPFPFADFVKQGYPEQDAFFLSFFFESFEGVVSKRVCFDWVHSAFDRDFNYDTFCFKYFSEVDGFGEGCFLFGKEALSSSTNIEKFLSQKKG